MKKGSKKKSSKAQRYVVGAGTNTSHHRTLKGARRAAQPIANKNKKTVTIRDTQGGKAHTVKPRKRRRHKHSSGLLGGLF